ncbi:nucleolar protein 7 isoform X2 [Aquila chrysaetos chrysaetos]|uniref:Nucleolar protein 7 n=2 Tax=Aquila chrysaetos chrysaetos TaxID=223781 RepID=A0A663F836_AQUCH|nr:nucleolar protein 7 isoform X2 [Aquila chrysaetos chrysaetos]
MAVARRRKAAGGGKRGPPAALLSPPSSEDEAPEEVSFGVAKEAAETERRLVGEAVRRHRELLREKRRRRQELFTEQKKRKLLPEALLQELAAAPTDRGEGQAAAADRGKHRGGRAVKQRQGQAAKQRQGRAQRRVKKDKQRKSARSKGNYTAVCLKDQSITGLHQQLAKDFLNTHLYGPDANRAQANDFFSLENKKNPVKKAAVQFVDKSWGQEKKERATRFKKIWLATQIKKQV